MKFIFYNPLPPYIALDEGEGGRWSKKGSLNSTRDQAGGPIPWRHAGRPKEAFAPIDQLDIPEQTSNRDFRKSAATINKKDSKQASKQGIPDRNFCAKADQNQCGWLHVAHIFKDLGRIRVTGRKIAKLFPHFSALISLSERQKFPSSPLMKELKYSPLFPPLFFFWHCQRGRAILSPFPPPPLPTF